MLIGCFGFFNSRLGGTFDRLRNDFARDLGFGFGAGLELLDAAGCIDELLLASVERMASAAKFGLDLRQSGANSKGIAAGANHFGFFVILGVDVFFHIFALFPECYDTNKSYLFSQ